MFRQLRGAQQGLIGALGLCLALATGAGLAAAEIAVECQVLYESADGIYVSAGGGSKLKEGEMGWLEREGRQILRVEVASVSTQSAFLHLIGARPPEFPAAGDQVTLTVSRDESPTQEPETRRPSPTLKDRRAADEAAVPLAPGDVDAPTLGGSSRPDSPPSQDEGTAQSGEAQSGEAQSGEAQSDTAQSDTPQSGAAPAPRGEAPPNGTKPFVPLLAPEKADVGAFTDAYNIFQGQLSVRQLFQVTRGEDLDYFVTHVRSSGSVERIQATPWALEWSGDVSYRDGEALEDVRDFQTLRLELYRLSLYRRFDDQSWVRVGRFLPRELPSAGYLDGAQGEWVVNENLRLGGMTGFKPLRLGLDFSVKEPTQVGYATLRLGDDRDISYTGTLGVLASVYEGKFDRLALLAEQTLKLHELTVLSSSELDFDAGGAETRTGTRLTRWDLLATYPIFARTTLRAGIDRYERPDTAAERAAVADHVLEDVEFFDRGYWRYWAGASHELPWNLRLGEEVSVTDSEIDDWSLRWNVSLTRTGLPLLPSSSSVTLTAYNLEGKDLDGYGARLSGYIPFPGNRFSLQPAVVFRYLESDLHGTDRFTFTDVSLRAHWIVSRSWTVSGGVSYGYSEDVERFLVDLGVTFRW